MEPVKKDESPKERRLRFNQTIRIRRVPMINEISDEELEARWFSQDEYASFREDATQMALLLSYQEKVSGEVREYESLMQGVETKTEKKDRKMRVTNSRLALLREQQKYWDVETDRDFPQLMMAAVYSTASNSSRMMALKRGFALSFHVQFNMDEEPTVEGLKQIGPTTNVSPTSVTMCQPSKIRSLLSPAC